jgi:adenylate cyclase
MKQGPSRQLAVILHADVVGSTTLVRIDETLAHQRIQDAFRRFAANITDHGGTPHEIRGDALVAEFPRGSDAVEAALNFQVANAAHNQDLPDAVQPVVRVGIAMGEVVVADNTVTGEGVVLAQRLEQLAAPGRVCIQGAVYETVPKRLPFEYEGLGEHTLKGFEEPVRAYAVSTRVDAPCPAAEMQKLPETFTPKSPDKPSIAVLPFLNMSGDLEQEYFSDGITEDIITGLSRFRELFVIARNSTFRFKGRETDIAEIARELGVQYIVQGSVRKSGKRVRITGQLVDMFSGNEIWADHYDRELIDFFTVQDEVVAAIVGTLPGRIQHAELKRADRRTLDLRAYDLVQRAWQLVYKWTKAGAESATGLAERALEIEPRYGSAHAVLVAVQLLNWRRRWRGSPEETLELALKHGRMAVQLDETEYAGHWYLSEAYLFRMKDLEQAMVHAERAVKLCPNASGPTAWMGFLKGCSGKHQAGIELCTKALQHDPFAPDYLTYLASCVEFNARDYEKAIKTLHATEWISKPELLTATYANAGRLDEARKILATHIDAITPEMMQRPAKWLDYFAERCPYVREEDIDHYISGIEAAAR